MNSLFDFQVNGFAGVDFQHPALTRSQMRLAADELLRRGVGGILLTLITDTESRLEEQFGLIERFRREDPIVAQVVRGYHLEGPWLRPEVGYCGAHPRELMSGPSLPAFSRLQKAAAGRIRLVTLAPEWPRSAEVIAAICAEGVHVALGHTNATDAEITAAIRAGARFCTHLGNGVPGILPRHDNIVQRLLARDELTACFIPDGVHLPPCVLQNFFRAKPVGKVLFTTDGASPAGAGPGSYTIGGRIPLQVGSDGVVRDPGASAGFAGSSLTPDVGVELTMKFLGLPREEAHRLWSSAPCLAFGFASEELGVPVRSDH